MLRRRGRKVRNALVNKQKLSTEAVWSRFRTDLWQFIRRRVADDHTADDLLQETFVRIHRNVDSLTNAERLGPWVFKIARNLVNDHYRRGAEKTASLVDTASADDEPEQELKRQGIGWMNEMIQELPAKYREPVQLAEIEGLPQQEIANRLGLTFSGAKSRVQRGRVLLKEVLDQCCTFHIDQRGNVMDCDPKPGRTVCRDCDADL